MAAPFLDRPGRSARNGHGEHACLIYGDAVERLAVVIPFLREGLRRRERCLYLAGAAEIGEVRTALQAAAVDVAGEIARGALVFVSGRDCAVDEPLDARLMLEELRQSVLRAREQGFTALRFGVEMAWALEFGVLPDALIEAEMLANASVFPALPVTALCQYQRNRFPAALLRDALRGHPIVIVEGEPQPNPYYEPPELAVTNPASTQIDWMLSQLRRARTAEQEWTRLIGELAERTEAEAAHRQLESIFNSLADPCLALDTAGRITFLNRVAQRFLAALEEREDGDLVGQSLWSRLPPAVGEHLRDAAQRFLGEHDGDAVELQAPVDGRWYEVRFSPGPGGLVLHLADITQRKLAADGQRFLAEASAVLASSLDYETTMRQVVELAVPRLADWCAVDLVQTDGTVARLALAHVDAESASAVQEMSARYSVNPQAEFGIVNVMRSGESLYYPDIADELLPGVARDAEHLAVLRKLCPRSAVIAPLVARGRILGSVTAVTARSGRRYTPEDRRLVEELAHVAALAIDNARLYQASERRMTRATARAAASRRVAEARLDPDAIFDSIIRVAGEQIGDAVAIRLLSDGQLVAVASYHPDLAMARVLSDLLALSPVPLGEGITGRVATTGKPFRGSRTEPEPRMAAGPRFWSYYERVGAEHMLMVPVRAGGRILGVLALLRFASRPAYTDEDETFAQELADIAGLALDNAELYQQAQDALRSRETFLSIASHELRTPLTTVKGFVQLLDRILQRPEADRTRVLSLTVDLQQQVRRLEDLVADLLDVSRLHAGQLPLRREQVDLVDVARLVLARFESDPETMGYPGSTALVLWAPEPVIGVWDAGRLDQVLTNLVSNAVKFSPDGGQVEIRVTARDGAAEVMVRDEGPGIAPEEQEPIFEPFARGRAGETVGGTGLGLYVARQIVEQHGGTITVQSALGAGATFVIRLPLEPTEGDRVG